MSDFGFRVSIFGIRFSGSGAGRGNCLDARIGDPVASCAVVSPPADPAQVELPHSFSQVENNSLTEMCRGSKAGLYLRLIDFLYHSTLGLRVMKKKKKVRN